MKYLILAVLIVLTLLNTVAARADAPFNDLEGVGGVAYNPLAYLGGEAPSQDEKKPWDSSSIGGVTKFIGKPRFGTWYVNLSDVGVNWFAAWAETRICVSMPISPSRIASNSR